MRIWVFEMIVNLLKIIYSEYSEVASTPKFPMTVLLFDVFRIFPLRLTGGVANKPSGPESSSILLASVWIKSFS